MYAMNIHEYQAKEILRRYGVPTLQSGVATTPDEAVKAAEAIGGSIWVVKAQIHAGGRGKAGGVKLARSLDEVRSHAAAILGAVLVTHQTGPEGKEVQKVLVEAGCDIDRELYAGLTLDRAAGRLTVMVSTEGGVEIEEVAAKSPEKILKATIDPAFGLWPNQARELAFGMGLEGKVAVKVAGFIEKLSQAFIATDAAMAEINPLVLTKGGDVLALDAKMGFDDNALYRQPDVEAMRDLSEEDAKETEAKEWNLSYIALDGDIGCLVNGAGLAMATMDTIQHFGGSPANFLDVGGGAKKDQVAAAFKIILKDPNVKAILVNIFGGIMRCDVIAEGVVAAVREVNLGVPLVVRLEGTNVEAGRKILTESGLPIESAASLAEGAQKAVAAVRGA
jgi:succinyl-CoA synthetase beta subunit